ENPGAGQSAQGCFWRIWRFGIILVSWCMLVLQTVETGPILASDFNVLCDRAWQKGARQLGSDHISPTQR
ncbi:hypothetical protein, partial [uncultured Aliiroseovarius sp.]|uniref:hypothetical protein n=1 Tax=uncultured Aliiroseovarius sp. TaxID=1658783 RepID=UPI002595552C